MHRRALPALVLTAMAGFAQLDWRTLPDRAVRSALAGARVNSQVGSGFDFRVTSTDRSYNYKLRATWITPGATARAVARSGMLLKGWNTGQAEAVLRAIEENNNWIVLIELDPREGSGIIPKDWISHFGAQGSDDRRVTGSVVQEEGVWQQITSAFPRDYAYDRFLVQFPMENNGKAVLQVSDVSAELRVQIYQKHGRVTWNIPAGVVK